MLNTIILPYKRASASAKVLGNATQVPVVSPHRKQYRKDLDIVVNWGCGTFPGWILRREKYPLFLNDCFNVSRAINKDSTFSSLGGKKHVSGIPRLPVPEFTSSVLVANEWKKREIPFVARTLVKASKGKGIILVDKDYKEEDWKQAKLFVHYIPSAREYRLHVFNGHVIDYTQKRRKDGYRDNKNYNNFIRNHNNGWIYCHDSVVESEEAATVAILAIDKMGLFFGAVDVLVKHLGTPEEEVFILEINTAPGLESERTIKAYAGALTQTLKKVT